MPPRTAHRYARRTGPARRRVVRQAPHDAGPATAAEVDAEEARGTGRDGTLRLGAC